MLTEVTACIDVSQSPISIITGAQGDRVPGPRDESAVFVSRDVVCRQTMETNMRTLMTEELVFVSGGCIEEPPPPTDEKCNNGWGNGESCAPGNSLAHQPKFEDPDTGTSPSGSPVSGGGDR